MSINEDAEKSNNINLIATYINIGNVFMTLIGNFALGEYYGGY